MPSDLAPAPLVVTMADLIILTVLGTSIWVGFDARAHGFSWAWGLGCLAMWIVVFPWYLVLRTRMRPVASPAAQSTGPPPPGWYDDPYQPGRRRYWDGLGWTQSVDD